MIPFYGDVPDISAYKTCPVTGSECEHTLEAASKLGINSPTFRNSSLDQLRLLRSQHKMARLLLVAALCLASVKAAVIPVEEIVDNLQVWFSLDFNNLTFVYFGNNSFPPRAS